MSSVSVNHADARKILNSAWERVDDGSIVAPSKIVTLLENLILASDVTFKYILVTGLLGKCTNKAVHPRALQVNSDLEHSYDARSLCHDVIVSFEKTKGDLLGLSNEPFLNKPARHPEHYESNNQLRNKALSADLHNALEYAHTARPEKVFAMLVHVLRLGKRRATSQITASITVDTNYRKVISFVDSFLQESDGGVRLVAVVGAFITLLNNGLEVKVYPPNFSDKFAKTAGDIEIHHDEKLLSAYECKHRPTNLDDIRHGIKKAKDKGVFEYCFVIGSGYSAGEEESIKSEILTTKDLDVLLIDINTLSADWVSALNPIRRSKFGDVVANLLRQMKRSEVANKSAELWNSLK